MDYKFKDLSLKDNGVVMTLDCKKQLDIPFSEIEKVYISIHKKPRNSKSIWIIGFIFSVGLQFVFLFYFPFFVVFSLPLFLICLLAIRDYYNHYHFNIVAKKGHYFFKKISCEYKYDTLLLIECIRKKI